MSNPYEGLPPRAVTMVRELQRMGYDVVKSVPRAAHKDGVVIVPVVPDIPKQETKPSKKPKGAK